MCFAETITRRANLIRTVAIIGLLGPNGLFLYIAFTEPMQVVAAVKNPVSLAFMVEAVMIMGLCAWILAATSQRNGPPHPVRAWMFVAASIIGSLAFSVPMALVRLAEGVDQGGEETLRDLQSTASDR